MSLTESVLANTDQTRECLGLGLGLRHSHMDAILAGEAKVDWFEAISENYLGSGGRSLYDLRQVAEQYPIVLHGVSMSIGSSDPLNIDYLSKLKKLASEVNPRWVSDHLCWTGVMGLNSHDLLPVPLNDATLKHISERVCRVQDFLGRQLVLENPSSYMSFKQSTFNEPDFLHALVSETGCGLLLDVNNVYVSSFNVGESPLDYFSRYPFEHVVQMHLAGHQHCGTHIIDTHDQPVTDDVWELFRLAWQQTNGVATCLEWDGNIPELAECEAELFKARNYINSSDTNPLRNSHDENANLEITLEKYHSVSNPVSFMVPDVMDNVVSDIT